VYMDIMQRRQQANDFTVRVRGREQIGRWIDS
jgi:hypothetical protein